MGDPGGVRAGGGPRSGLLVAAVATLGLLAVAGAVVLVASRFTWGGFDLDTDIGPGDGTRSQRLDVAVEPRTGLADGQEVLVASEAFSRHQVVGVAVCLSEADTESRGVEACDTASGQRFATDVDGRLAVTFPVPRVITVDGGAHDCAEREGRCVVVAADASSFDRSGGQPVSFAPDLPAVDLVAGPERPRTDLLPGSLDPPGPVAVGDTLTVTTSGFVPGEPLLVAVCDTTFLTDDPWEACAPAGPTDMSTATEALMGHSVEGIDLRAGPDGTVSAEVVAPEQVEGLGSPTSCRGGTPVCAVVVAAAADTRRSAYLPFALDAG